MAPPAALAARDRRPELMDDPTLGAERHAASLRGLGRVNWWSGSSRILWSALEPLVPPGRTLRILDVASGGGDVPIALWHRARRRGVRLVISGCDVSDAAVQFARARATHAGANVHFFERDVIRDGLPDGYDVVVSSLFLHHLSPDDARGFLENASRAASRAVLVQDLVRSTPGYWFAYFGTRFITRSDVVHTDGPLSVRAAFTERELRDLAATAGLESAAVEQKWPFRQLLVWRAP